MSQFISALQVNVKSIAHILQFDSKTSGGWGGGFWGVEFIYWHKNMMSFVLFFFKQEIA
jgi:hypothetical protein